MCYITEIVWHFGMANANPTCILLPASADTHLTLYNEEATPKEIKYYQQIIGSLIYVQIATRLDIAFAIAHLAQYVSNSFLQYL
jgi:hypothetical protein